MIAVEDRVLDVHCSACGRWHSRPACRDVAAGVLSGDHAALVAAFDRLAADEERVMLDGELTLDLTPAAGERDPRATDSRRGGGE